MNPCILNSIAAINAATALNPVELLRIPANPATHFGSIRPPEPVIPAASESEVVKRPTSGLLNP
jgi:hypothetical protein